jgi:hypothetical protein
MLQSLSVSKKEVQQTAFSGFRDHSHEGNKQHITIQKHYEITKETHIIQVTHISQH